METIQLTLTVEETNQILKALGELPFVRVASLVQKVKQQAENQLLNGQMEEKSDSRKTSKPPTSKQLKGKKESV